MLDGLDCSFIVTPDSEGHSCKKGLSSLDLSHHVVFLFFFLKNFFNGFTCICAHDALIAAGEPPLRGEFLHIPGLCFFMTTVPDFWCVNSTFNQHKDMGPLCFSICSTDISQQSITSSTLQRRSHQYNLTSYD